jgi:hypothetical protein
LLTRRSRRAFPRTPRASSLSTDSRLYLVRGWLLVSLMRWVGIASGFNFQRSLEGRLIGDLFSQFLPCHGIQQRFMLGCTCQAGETSVVFKNKSTIQESHGMKRLFKIADPLFRAVAV